MMTAENKMISYLIAGARLQGCQISMIFDHSGRTITDPRGVEYVTRGLGLGDPVYYGWRRGNKRVADVTLESLLRRHQPITSDLISEARRAIQEAEDSTEGSDFDEVIDARDNLSHTLHQILDIIEGKAS